MSEQKIKRVTKGGFIKVDTTGTGEWEIGRIVDWDANTIHFESAKDGETVRVSRDHAYKASREEWEAMNQEATGEEDEQPEELDDEAPAEEEDEDEDEDEDEESRSIVRKHYKQRYIHAKTSKGRATQISGDPVSLQLAEKDLEGVYEEAAEILNVDVEDLYAKYEHLNPGQQRMVLGNRIRHHLKAQGQDSKDE